MEGERLMKKIVVFGLSLPWSVLLIVAIAMGQGIGGFRGYAVGPAIPGLTAEQISKIQSLRQAYLEKIEPLWVDLAARRKEIRSLWLAPNPDRAAVTAKEREILSLQSKLQKEAANFRLEMRKMLTPEQQAQFGAFGPGRRFAPGVGEKDSPGGRGNPNPERMPANER